MTGGILMPPVWDFAMQRVEIRVLGKIDEHWSEWFDGLTVAHTELDQTVLSGLVADQAALYGLLAKVRDLGLGLISVNIVSMEPDITKDSTV